jgi:TorA maturation chaperone TorD
MLNGLKKPMGQPYSEIAKYIPRMNDIELLKIDYSKLFVGPYGLLAPPYGSVYLENNGRIMGDSTMDVGNRYRKEGLDIVIKEAPDHIAVELEFMYFLIFKEIEARENSEWGSVTNYVKKQKDFLKIHVGMWVPEFADNIEKNAETQFYKSLSRATRSFILMENKMANIPAAELALPSDSG